MSDFSKAINNHQEYVQGYSDGYKEGYNKAFQTLYKELQLAQLSKPIKAKLDKNEYTEYQKQCDIEDAEFRIIHGY